MARARNIKPALFKNELLGQADPLLTLLFQNLWCLADKEGRMEDRPLRIKAETFPYRDGLDVNGYLTQLEQLGFIKRYRVNGTALIQVINFKKHQTPHSTEKASELPGPELADPEPAALEAKQTLTTLDNGELTQALPPDSLIPDSGFLIPDSLIPDCLIPENFQQQPRCDDASIATVTVLNPIVNISKTKAPAKTASTWQAYSDAYQDRYGTLPVRNNKVNGMIAQFFERLGYSEAPHVAAFYVGHNNAYYVREMHAVGAMLKDAEKLRTEWATNTRMTATRAQQVDRTQTNFDSFAPLIAAAEAKERANG